MRSRVRVSWSLGLTVVIALALVPSALARSAATTVYSSAHVGLLYPVGTTGGAHAAAAVAGPSTLSRGARRRPRHRAGNAPTVAPARVAGQAISAAPPSLLANFNGTSSNDSFATNFGQKFEPPDQGLCVGNGYVVDMVNSAYTVYRPNGSVVTGPFNINGPFDEGLIEFTSDPRCMYDAATHTWFALILFINGDSTVSREDLAVNTSGDPTKLWTVYQIDTTEMGGKTGPKHPGCPCFGDQPRLGVDGQNVYISTDEFSILGPQFNGAQIYAIAKSDLVQGYYPTTPAHFVHFENLKIGGAPALAVQPSILTGTAPAEYFLSSLDPNSIGDQRIGVWAMTNRGVVASGGKPTLSSLVMPSEKYSFPPGAEQQGSSSLIDSGDDRMQQAQYLSGDVWGELGTTINPAGDSTPRAGAAWFDVKPVLSNGVVSNAQMVKQGYVSVAGNYLLYPALQATPSGRAAMVMTLTGPGRFPSAAYSVLTKGSKSFGPVVIAAPGTTNYDPQATRWGDYSYAVLNPTGTSVWMATEYIPPKASQTPDGVRNWGTRVLDLSTG